MSRQTLRQLAKDYAKGVIEKDEYRKSRTDLIQGIVAGKIEVKPINFVEPLRPSDDSDEDITQGRDRDWESTQIASSNQASAKPKVEETSSAPAAETSKVTNKNKSNHIFIIISIVFVLALIIAVVLFYPKPPETNNSTSSANITTGTTNVSTNPEVLIGKFLNERNWSDKNLNKFVESWTELSQEDKDLVAGTNRMQRLKATIYDQFLKAKALASIDAEKAIEKQQKLIDFANAIGVVDSRLLIAN
ncbi:MAG: hypothetical protein ACPHLK_02795 [Gammaproteobacteria bacterium]|jgi:hypothetical protein